MNGELIFPAAYCKERIFSVPLHYLLMQDDNFWCGRSYQGRHQFKIKLLTTTNQTIFILYKVLTQLRFLSSKLLIDIGGGDYHGFFLHR